MAPARCRWLALGTFAALTVWVSNAMGASVPILAGPWAHGQRGYGRVKPTTIYNGGDPSGLVRLIHWSSWGGPRAIGSGVAEYIAANQDVAGGSEEPARIVLFQRGTCRGRFAYNAIEWYFPQHGEHFNAHAYINACTGEYHQ